MLGHWKLETVHVNGLWIMDYEFIDDAFNYTIVNEPVKTPENEYEGEYLSGLMLPL
jgi:hypothetical protein